MIFFAERCAASERNMQRGGAAAQGAPEMRGPRGGADLWSPRARLHAGARGGYLCRRQLYSSLVQTC